LNWLYAKKSVNQFIKLISVQAKLLDKLQMNCVPIKIMGIELRNYQEFWAMRRMLMAGSIRGYYWKMEFV